MKKAIIHLLKDSDSIEIIIALLLVVILTILAVSVVGIGALFVNILCMAILWFLPS
ncbi:MAG: hypothetical protein FWG90_01700 [Oscillospiraceae bacterium]|nr:hypothetical protein [Oscillospiraceae bacterium]